MKELQKVLVVKRVSSRGGAIYERMVEEVLGTDFKVDILTIDPARNSLLYFNKLKYYYQISRFRHFSKYDVVITNKDGIYGNILSRGVKHSVLVLHHINFNENRHPLFRKYLGNQLLNAFNKVGHVVVVAHYWKEKLSAYMPAEKISVIQNAFDTAYIATVMNGLNREKVRESFGFPKDKIVVYAGSAIRAKGYEKVLRLLDPSKFHVVTSGQKEQDNLARTHLDLDYENYLKLLHCVDITVILSEFLEGWNRCAHESLLCGTPVIGTPETGLGELLANAGQYTWTPVDDLEKIVYQALSDDEVRGKGLSYASQFGYDYFAAQWKGLITKWHEKGNTLQPA